MKDKFLKVIVPLAFWLALWAIAAAVVGKELILPAPAAVGRSLCALVVTSDFWRSALTSLLRVLAGFLMGTAGGVMLAAATAASVWADRLFSPALRAVRTVPVVSFILLLFFSLPNTKVPAAVSALMALPVVWRAARQGLASADPLLLEMASAYGFGRWKTIRLIYIPAALPALAAGCETALGLAWKSGMAAEVLCQPKWAAGSRLQSAKAYLDTPGLIAWTVVIVALSLAMEGLLRLLFRRWRGAKM